MMIIQSALDTDTYKITMMQAILHQCPGVNVDYLFKCRTPDIDFRPYLGDIVKNVNKMCREVHFTKEDLDYLASLRFIKSDFIDFLRFSIICIVPIYEITLFIKIYELRGFFNGYGQNDRSYKIN